MDLKQLEPVEVEVGGNKFYITPFPAFKAANMTGELASVLAPILGAVLPLADNGSIGDIEITQVAGAIQNVQSLDGDKVEKLTRKMLLGGHIVVKLVDEETGEENPQRLNEDLVNEIFCAEIQDMFILVAHVIKINFGGFFSKLNGQSGMKSATEMMRKARIVM